MTTINKGDVLAGTGASNQFTTLPAGTNGQFISYDNTTPTGLKAIDTASPVVTEEIYVSVQGSDTTGDGSSFNPYATFTKAWSVITSPSSSNPYTIVAAPGIYNETDFAIKPWVSIAGAGYFSTYINVTNPISLDVSWTSVTGVLQTISNLNTNASTWSLDFNTLSAQGEIDFNNFYNPTGDMAFIGKDGAPSAIAFFNSQYYIANFNATNTNLFYNSTFTEAYSSFTNAAVNGTAVSSYIQGGQFLDTLVSSSDATSTNTIQYQGVDVDRGISLIAVNPGATYATGDSSSYPRLGFTLSGPATADFPFINHARPYIPRTIASGTAYQPSLTHDTFVKIRVNIVNVASVSSSATLDVSPDNSTWTTIDKTATDVITAGDERGISAIVPASYYYRVTTSVGAGSTVTLSTAEELFQ